MPGFDETISLVRGSALTLRFLFRKKSSQILDLTGATLTFIIAKDISVKGEVEVLELTKPLSIIGDPKNGKAEVKLGSVDTDRTGMFYTEVHILFAGATGPIKPLEAQIMLELTDTVKF